MADVTIQMNHWAAHTQEVLAVLNDARLQRVRMQNSLWLYRATKGEKHVDLFRRSRAELGENVAKLRVLTSDNPRQGALLDKIESLTREQSILLQEAMDKAATAVQKGTAIDFTPAYTSSDELPGLLKSFEDNERNLFAQRSQAVQRSAQTTIYLQIGTGMVSFAALLFAGYQTKKEVLKRVDIEAGLLRAQVLMGMQLSEERNKLGNTLGDLHVQIVARNNAEDELRRFNSELEERVKQRTRQLEEMNRELESFSYSVSHDLRAPLRHMDGFSRMLEEEFGRELPEGGKHYVQRIRSAAAQMSKLVEDLLELSRVGRRAANCRPIELTVLVEDAKREVLGEAAGRKIIWEIEKLGEVEADPVLLRQVFTNLLSNAIKFTRQRDRALIEVGSRRDGSRTVFYVRDNGVGFDPRYADKLFGVFQRLHRQDEFEGTGIGLATVHRIIQKHGGKIWAESQPGQGAIFYFTVNIANAEEFRSMEAIEAKA